MIIHSDMTFEKNISATVIIGKTSLSLGTDSEVFYKC